MIEYNVADLVTFAERCYESEKAVNELLERYVISSVRVLRASCSDSAKVELIGQLREDLIRDLRTLLPPQRAETIADLM